MRYSNLLMGHKTPFIPVSSSEVGLTEKRLSASSWLAASDSATLVAELDREADTEILLDSDAEYHKNNAEDPATETLNLLDAASSSWDFNRGVTHDASLNDFAHVSYFGNQPQGDSYLGRSTVTANEAVVIGQPVYISDNNTVNLADSDSITTAHVIGLAETSANGVTGNNTVNILSEGTINQEDWTDVIATQYLTPGETYYLRGGRGTMSTTPPSGDGDVVVSCGIAITTTKFSIEINEIAVL